MYIVKCKILLKTLDIKMYATKKVVFAPIEYANRKGF